MDGSLVGHKSFAKREDSEWFLTAVQRLRDVVGHSNRRLTQSPNFIDQPGPTGKIEDEIIVIRLAVDSR